jgi:hypothetical protein
MGGKLRCYECLSFAILSSGIYNALSFQQASFPRARSHGMRCVNIGCHARRQSHVKRHVPQHQSQQIARAVASSAHSATINSIVNLTLVVSDSLNSGGAGQPPPSPSSTAVVSRTNPPPPPSSSPFFTTVAFASDMGSRLMQKVAHV